MSNTVSVADLITMVRERANMEVTQFVTDAEILRYLNRSWKKLYNSIVNQFQRHFVATPYTFPTVQGTEMYTLPTDFLKMLGVEQQLTAQNGGQWMTLQPRNFAERNIYSTSWLRVTTPGALNSYIIIGNELKIDPTPTAAMTIRLWYNPVAKTLVTSGSPATGEANSIDAINGFDDYVVIDSAIKCLQKEESDTSALVLERQDAYQVIQESLAPRDAGMSDRVADVSDVNGEMFPYGGRW